MGGIFSLLLNALSGTTYWLSLSFGVYIQSPQFKLVKTLASYLTPLTFSLFICKLGILILFCLSCSED